jgi:hypothetical protein
MSAAMRALVLLAVASSAPASPLVGEPALHSRAPDAIAADRAWRAAEHERDPAKALPLWQAAGLAFEQVRADREAEYAAMLAYRNAKQLEAPADRTGPLSITEAGMLRTTDNPGDARIDEVLYNAGVCYELGGAIADALKAYDEVMTQRPKSSMATRARARAAKLRRP